VDLILNLLIIRGFLGKLSGFNLEFTGYFVNLVNFTLHLLIIRLFY